MGKKAKRVYDENGNVTHKVCSKCGELKSIDEFNAIKNVSDGHRSRCKECNKKYREEYKEREKRNVTHKTCSKCGELKGIDEFNLDKGKSDGHVSRCKECNKKYREEYKEREKRNATYKVCSKCGELKGIDEFNLDKGKSDGHGSRCKECDKKYREENKEQLKEYNKKYREENKEQLKEYNKKYREENKERTKYNVTHKVCSKCGELKGINEFNLDKGTPDGHVSKCKECRKKYREELCDEAITRIKTIVEQDPTRYDYKVGEEIYGVIYLVCCKPINKYYVGQTTIGFDNRYKSGFLNDKGHRAKDDLKEDLERYGEDSFKITEIFKVAHNKEELDDLEVYYIDYFDSYYNGYNETRGNHHIK